MPYNVSSAKRDVLPFISDARVLEIWSQEFFLGVIEGLEFE